MEGDIWANSVSHRGFVLASQSAQSLCLKTKALIPAGNWIYLATAVPLQTSTAVFLADPPWPPKLPRLLDSPGENWDCSRTGGREWCWWWWYWWCWRWSWHPPSSSRDDGPDALQASINLRGPYNHPHFKDEETEAQMGNHSSKWGP